MKKRAALFILVALFLASPAHAALAIDGSATTTTNTGGVLTITLTTTSTNDTIYVCNTATSGNTSSISDTAALSWTQRKILTAVTGMTADCWYAWSTGVLTSDVISVSNTNGIRTLGFGVSGGASGSVAGAQFDTSASFAKTAGVNSGTSVSATVSTNTPNVILISYMRTSGSVSADPPGWTTINSPSTSTHSVYKILSTSQTNVVATYTMNTAAENMIVDAICSSAGCYAANSSIMGAGQ